MEHLLRTVSIVLAHGEAITAGDGQLVLCGERQGQPVSLFVSFCSLVLLVPA